MADLATLLSRRQECDDRAQLILVTALALAAIFLGLAIIVNSAIFTENLATRSENVESTEALEYRHGVTQFAGGVVEFANEHNSSSYGTIEENVDEGIEDINAYTGRQQIEGGAAVSLDLDKSNSVEGSRIFQNDGGNFTNNENEKEWTVASDVGQTRAFVLRPDSVSDTFRVIANDTAEGEQEWVLELDTTDDEITVSVDGDEKGECDYDEGDPIHITGATVGGEVCPALIDTEDGESLHFANGLEEYDIEFENADDIEGNYSLIVDNDDIDSDDDRYASSDDPAGSPVVTPAMYSAKIDFAYETSRVEYETKIRVAPGERP